MSKTLDQLETNEDIFHFVKDHLLKQNRRSIDADAFGSCLYREKSGLKCAVGSIIKDEFYCVGLENITVNSAIFEYRSLVHEAIKKSLPNMKEDIDFSLLERVQKVHDLELVESWKHELDIIENCFVVKKKPISEETTVILRKP